MPWDAPVEPRYLPYGIALAAVGALAAAVALLFTVEALRRRLPVPPRLALLVSGGGVASAAGLAWLVQAVGPGPPAWDLAGAALLRGVGEEAPLLQGLALAGSFPVLLTLLFLLFAWTARRGRWREAYALLLGGGGLVGSLLLLKLRLPRSAPVAQPFFAGPTAFPNDVSALAPAILAAFLLLRGRPLRGRSALPLAALCGLVVLAPLLLGQARPSDALAGALLAGTWLALSGMGWALVAGSFPARPQPPGATPTTPILPRILGRADAGAQRVFARPEPWLWGAIALGVGLRVASFRDHLGVDAFPYAVMGHQLLRTGSFTMPWGDVHTYATAPVASHHYPPLFPAYLAAFYKALGFSQATTHVASIASGLAALLVTWLCTRDLYGRRKALVATAVVALCPAFVRATGQGYSENLVLLLFVATLWAILRSLERPWFIVPAGLFAGLGYLTKGSMGAFFVVAGLGGLAWRLHWRGWKVLREPPYLTAILAFGALVAAWALRNLLHFGTWETSRHIGAAYRHALAHPLEWAALFLVTLVFYAVVGYLAYLALLPWLPHLARIPRLADEHDSGLWLALGLPLLLSAAIDAALWLVEREFFLANVRYAAFVVVPAAWLLLRHADPRQRSVRLATVGTFLVLGLLVLAVRPPTSNLQAVADDLGARLEEGDSVGWVDSNVHGLYRFYFQLTRDGTRHVPVAIACQDDPLCPPGTPGPGTLDTTWVLAAGDGTGLPPHYAPVTDSPARHDPRFPSSMGLWRRT